MGGVFQDARAGGGPGERAGPRAARGRAVAGCRVDHGRQGMQMAIALAVAMVFVVDPRLYRFFNDRCR